MMVWSSVMQKLQRGFGQSLRSWPSSKSRRLAISMSIVTFGPWQLSQFPLSQFPLSQFPLSQFLPSSGFATSANDQYNHPDRVPESNPGYSSSIGFHQSNTHLSKVFDDVWNDWNNKVRQLSMPNGGSNWQSPPLSEWKPREALIAANVAVYVLWKFCPFRQLFFRHFVASPENLVAGRIHSLVLSGFTHLTLAHLIANCFGIYVFLSENCIGNLLTPKEIYWLYVACSGIASLLQVRRSQLQVVGASGALMGFILLGGILMPNQQFMILFPIPGMLVSSAQIMQFAFFLNAFFTVFGRGGFVAWYGHLVGMAVAGVYAGYCRHVIKDSRFQAHVPSIRESVSLWKTAVEDFVDNGRLYWLRFELRRSGENPIRWAELKFRLDEIEKRKLERKLARVKRLNESKRR